MVAVLRDLSSHYLYLFEFAEFCARIMTYIDVDNTSARAWVDFARCPPFPFDRSAQGNYLMMVDLQMKVKTYWFPSEV